MNILVVKADEHNPKYSSVYGHPIVQTPHLARLAERGVVFESAYTPSPLCRPARSAYLAGRRVHQLQTYSNCSVIRRPAPSYGRLLASAGVRTVHMGKVDAYDASENLGFSEMALAQDRPSPGDVHIRRTPLDIRDSDGRARATMYGPVARDPFTTDTAVVERALQWLNDHGRSGPWILDVNLNAPHFPHHVPQSLWDLYPEGAEPVVFGATCASAQHPRAQDLREHFATSYITHDHTIGHRRDYFGCVTAADAMLGRLVSAVEQLGLAKETVIAYTADHGEMLGKFGMWWKCSLYEDSARVPMVVAGPGFARGARTKTPVDLLDLQATLFAVNRVRMPDERLGADLRGISRSDKHRTLFTEYHGHGTRASSFMLRQGDWKYVHHVGAPAQLFNVVSDPDELTNLATERASGASQLRALLQGVCNPDEENRRAEATIERELELALPRSG